MNCNESFMQGEVSWRSGLSKRCLEPAHGPETCFKVSVNWESHILVSLDEGSYCLGQILGAPGVLKLPFANLFVHLVSRLWSGEGQYPSAELLLCKAMSLQTVT